jgi:hypothetical protein
MQQLKLDCVERCIDLAHPDRIATVVGVKLRRQPATRRANLGERGIGTDTEDLERVRVHAVDG